MEKKHPKVALIIPAYNEAERIGAVLDEVVKAPVINEIIVVDDGSIDTTVEVAGRHEGVTVISRDLNGGKGAALKIGIDSTDAEILVLIDADLIGLKVKHIEDLVEPLLLEEDLEMTRGKFTKGRTVTNISQAVVPNISGQRAFKRKFLTDMPDFTNSGYGVEVAFTRQIRRKQTKVKEVILPNVTHVMKEEKLGLRKGLLERFKMYRDIFYLLIEPNKKG